MPYTADDKLQWEVEKLKEDIAMLRRPWVTLPASWLAIAATVVSVAGFAFQWSTQDLALREAEVQAKQAKVDRDLAVIDKSRVDQERDAALVQLTQIKLEWEQLSGQLRGNSKAQTAAAQTVAAVDSAAFRAGEAIASLTELGKSTFNLDSGAFAVVASFETLDRALRHAAGLAAKRPALPYAVEVYRRAADRFAVTLGGPSSASEARNRAEFAKSSGLAPDAYVRFADNWGDNLAK